MKGILWALAMAVLLSGCAASPETHITQEDEILLTVDGREIPAWRYFCWLDRGLGAESGEELQMRKDRALADTVLYAAVEDMAAEYGLALSEKERAALTPGIWEELPQAQWQELAAVGALYGKLCAMELPEETLAAFAREAGWRTIDRILVPAGEGAADTAAQIFAQLNGSGESAFAAAKALSADKERARTFRPGEGVLDAALEEAAAALEEGQLSGILESEEGFSILYCLKTDLSQIRIPWVDHCLLDRVRGSRIEVLPAYETMDISKRIL